MSSAAYANDITGKAEDAAQAMLRADVTAGYITLVESSSILTAIDNADIPLPRVVCSCDSATVEEIFDGNWSADIDIVIYGDAREGTREQFREVCGQVWSRFFRAPEATCIALSNADIEFTAQFISKISQSKALIANDDLWEGKLTITVKCCGSVIP